MSNTRHFLPFTSIFPSQRPTINNNYNPIASFPTSPSYYSFPVAPALRPFTPAAGPSIQPISQGNTSRPKPQQHLRKKVLTKQTQDTMPPQKKVKEAIIASNKAVRNINSTASSGASTPVNLEVIDVDAWSYEREQLEQLPTPPETPRLRTMVPSGGGEIQIEPSQSNAPVVDQELMSGLAVLKESMLSQRIPVVLNIPVPPIRLCRETGTVLRFGKKSNGCGGITPVSMAGCWDFTSDVADYNGATVSELLSGCTLVFQTSWPGYPSATKRIVVDLDAGCKMKDLAAIISWEYFLFVLSLPNKCIFPGWGFGQGGFRFHQLRIAGLSLGDDGVWYPDLYVGRTTLGCGCCTKFPILPAQ